MNKSILVSMNKTFFLFAYQSSLEERPKSNNRFVNVVLSVITYFQGLAKLFDDK